MKTLQIQNVTETELNETVLVFFMYNKIILLMLISFAYVDQNHS